MLLGSHDIVQQAIDLQTPYPKGETRIYPAGIATAFVKLHINQKSSRLAKCWKMGIHQSIGNGVNSAQRPKHGSRNREIACPGLNPSDRIANLQIRVSLILEINNPVAAFCQEFRVEFSADRISGAPRCWKCWLGINASLGDIKPIA